MSVDTLPDQQAALGRFRALALADAALARFLGEVIDADSFADRAANSARAHGIALDAATIEAQIRPDPLGLTRWVAAPVTGRTWPPNDWLPISMTAPDGDLAVDWAYFGGAPLTDPFYEGSIRRALSLPFNRICRYRTSFTDFVNDPAQTDSLPPNGFIFHMSRCGSTLVSQMLAALPRNVAVSEAAPIDTMVQLGRLWPDLPDEQHCRHLRAAVAAFGRRRSGHERHYFIKLDSWHAMALPLFRRAFPETPWAFLYRDPVEVLVSQAHQRGMQMVPDILSPRLYGIDGAAGMTLDEYSACVLGKVCEAAADNAGAGGLAVNYRELPEAFWTKILPHFGVAYDAAERNVMRRAARYDAKSPHFEFASDSAAKQREATASIRDLAARHTGAAYRRLEALSATTACPSA